MAPQFCTRRFWRGFYGTALRKSAGVAAKVEFDQLCFKIVAMGKKKRKSDQRVKKEREDGHKRIEEKIIKKREKKLEEGTEKSLDPLATVKKKKKRKSVKRMKKEREEQHKRLEAKIIKKEEMKLNEGMIAREDALKEAGIKQEYNYADHQHIYNYADDREGAPIETIGDNIVKCIKCGNLKDGNLPDKEQCQCDWTKLGRESSPSLSPSPKPSRKHASPCPPMQKSVPGHIVSAAARWIRAKKIFEQNMAAAALKKSPSRIKTGHE